ncbi:hypothetical protein [Kingella potus]|uniref:hypothetical protein n=1 Tax=Kingella potus TaxID=265175 RepID=UPI0011C04A7C|nr:hypothetical protein [Kingella potus]UOP00167.1 hypothetical protein LVJ84_09495 [Kingella potus]
MCYCSVACAAQACGLRHLAAQENIRPSEKHIVIFRRPVFCGRRCLAEYGIVFHMLQTVPFFHA